MNVSIQPGVGSFDRVYAAPSPAPGGRVPSSYQGLCTPFLDRRAKLASELSPRVRILRGRRDEKNTPSTCLSSLPLTVATRNRHCYDYNILDPWPLALFSCQKQRDLGAGYSVWGRASCARGAARRGWPRADGPSRARCPTSWSPEGGCRGCRV